MFFLTITKKVCILSNYSWHFVYLNRLYWFSRARPATHSVRNNNLHASVSFSGVVVWVCGGMGGYHWRNRSEAPLPPPPCCADAPLRARLNLVTEIWSHLDKLKPKTAGGPGAVVRFCRSDSEHPEGRSRMWSKGDEVAAALPSMEVGKILNNKMKTSRFHQCRI